MENNKCYFEGTIWQPQIKTSTKGTTTWSAKLSVYKSKDEAGKYQYTQLFLRAYGGMADKLAQYKERDKIAVNTTYRSEEWQGKYYNFFQVNEIVEQPDIVVNNSPYAQSYSYARPAPQNDTRKPQPERSLFERELEPVQTEDELPF